MRLPDWQERFSDFGKARGSMPFAWGANDCCAFAAAAVLAITGANPMAAFPRYTSERQALRLIEDGGGLRALTSTALGAAVSPLRAGVGDVVLVINDDREMLGVCNGVNVMAPGELGMAVLSMEAALAAWKV